jgi:hypothetical protein
MMIQSVRLPKRLVEAWVGALAAQHAARLWAPTLGQLRTFAFEPHHDSTVLLQCSFADMRASGPSTRVSRAQIAAYLEDPALEGWRESTWFVMVDPDLEPIVVGSVVPNVSLPNLLAIRLGDVAALISDQGRGTVSADTLRALRGRPGSDVVELGAVFDGLAVSDVELITRAPHQRARGLDDGGVWWRFGLSTPTPIGVTRIQGRHALKEHAAARRR